MSRSLVGLIQAKIFIHPECNYGYQLSLRAQDIESVVLNAGPIMEYGSTPYVGWHGKKNGGTI